MLLGLEPHSAPSFSILVYFYSYDLLDVENRLECLILRGDSTRYVQQRLARRIFSQFTSFTFIPILQRNKKKKKRNPVSRQREKEWVGVS